ncbi:MAG: hypothetical protein PWP12_47 [Bacillota bacterium]|nr:hypothetical protein [Bacillota bacterium]MDK2881686.1 hypothetical protein [Bacillota bacterium]MDK2959863.1 hypothetical protein [Bacillota bacterium]
MQGSWELPEEELKDILARIARICTSREFQELRLELEAIYRRENPENACLAAFQDALYALFVQGEEALGSS